MRASGGINVWVVVVGIGCDAIAWLAEVEIEEQLEIVKIRSDVAIVVLLLKPAASVESSGRRNERKDPIENFILVIEGKTAEIK